LLNTSSNICDGVLVFEKVLFSVISGKKVIFFLVGLGKQDFFFKALSYYVFYMGLKLMILLPQASGVVRL
jgi:hypothetical protein